MSRRRRTPTLRPRRPRVTPTLHRSPRQRHFGARLPNEFVALRSPACQPQSVLPFHELHPCGVKSPLSLRSQSGTIGDFCGLRQGNGRRKRQFVRRNVVYPHTTGRRVVRRRRDQFQLERARFRGREGHDELLPAHGHIFQLRQIPSSLTLSKPDRSLLLIRPARPELKAIAGIRSQSDFLARELRLIRLRPFACYTRPPAVGLVGVLESLAGVSPVLQVVLKPAVEWDISLGAPWTERGGRLSSRTLRERFRAPARHSNASAPSQIHP